MTPEQALELLSGGGRYDRKIVTDLEGYVKEQLSSGSYDIDANLALLKLYLLYPEDTQVEIIEGVLLKALMAFPATDFSLCMYQIPEKHHQSLKDVVKLAQQLEMAKFKAFWKETESVEILGQAKGWQAAVRSFVAGVVASTYRSIKVEQLAELLNLQPGAELEAIIKEHAWTRSKEEKDTIVVNTHSFESVRVEVKQPTNMSLDQYRTLFAAANSA
mmetsp:Transcript_26817/g.61087  ORF Transcript_26817/g.61087 Transcript_26817/m.61087 type:complete len:217 (+) Transcript_26817:73-723(+)